MNHQTSQNDENGANVKVTQSGDTFTVTIGSTTKEYSSSEVKKIVFRGTDGYDVVDCSGVTGVVCDLSGGDGSDTLIGGSANDVIIGGFGVPVVIWGKRGSGSSN